MCTYVCTSYGGKTFCSRIYLFNYNLLGSHYASTSTIYMIFNYNNSIIIDKLINNQYALIYFHNAGNVFEFMI